MEELLERLGAGELPTSVELPEHAQRPAYFTNVHERLSLEIDRLNDETRDVLADNWDLFAAQYTTSKRLLSTFDDQDRQLARLEQRVHESSVPALRAKMDEHAKLARSYALTKASVELMRTLATLHSHVSHLSALVSDGALASAVEQAVPEVRAALDSVPDWIQSTGAFETLSQWATDEIGRLEDALVRTVESCFNWQGVPGQGTFTILARVNGPTDDRPHAEELHIRDILAMLDALWSPHRKGRVDQLLGALCNKLIQHILEPVIRGTTALSYSPSPPTATVSPVDEPDVLANVSSFLAFFASQTALLTTPYARAITLVMTPAVQSAIVSTFLAALLPSKCVDLPAYFEVANDACQFEAFLNDKGWFAHLPSPDAAESSATETVAIEERRVIRDWSERVGYHWAKSIGTNTLDALRADVKHFKWQASPVDVRVPIPREPTPPPSPVIVPASPPRPMTPPPAHRRPGDLEEEYTPYEVTEPEHQDEAAQKPKRGKLKLGTKVISKASPSLPFASPPLPSSSTPPPPPAAHNGHHPAPSSSTSNGHQVLLSPPASTMSQQQQHLSQNGSRPRAMSSTSSTVAPPDEALEDAWGFDIDDDLAIEEAGAPVAMSPSLSSQQPAPLAQHTHDLEAHEPAPTTYPYTRPDEPAAEEEGGGGEADGWNLHDDEHADEEEADGWGFEDEEGGLGEDEESLIGVSNPIASPSMSAKAHLSPSMHGNSHHRIPEESSTAASSSSRRPSNVSDAPPLPPPSVAVTSSIAMPTEAQSGLFDPDDRFEGPEGEDDEEAGWGWDDQPLSIGSSPQLERSSPGFPSSSSSAQQQQPNDIVSPPSHEWSMVVPAVVPTKAREEFRTEQMLVSDLSRTVVRYCEGILDELAQVREQKQAKTLPRSFDSASSQLSRAFFAVLSLYRALMPVQHQRALSSVSAIALQFSNDAKWIADEVAALARQRDHLLAQDEIEAAVKAMTALSAEWKLKAIRVQRDDLWESLDEANHFLDVGDDARFAACERAIRQVVHALNQTQQAWRPVITSTELYATLGELVNDVLQRVLDDIEDQVDISEDESIRLNRLCKELHELERLFDGTSSSTSVGREVPVWFKFVFLSELLEASMADIIFLFDHGHLVDFSVDEIAKLVRALFADSPLRQKNLEHIRRGHPDPDSIASYD